MDGLKTEGHCGVTVVVLTTQDRRLSVALLTELLDVMSHFMSNINSAHHHHLNVFQTLLFVLTSDSREFLWICFAPEDD